MKNILRKQGLEMEGTIVESETIESIILEKSQFQSPIFDHESKYETLRLQTRYYYTVIIIIIRSNPTDSNDEHSSVGSK